MTYRILSLDGGGIRGIFTARILERLCKARYDFLSNIDLIAGTSTGAIIAVLLAAGRTPQEIVDLYREYGRLIFSNNILHDVQDLWGIIGARYTTADRFAALYREIGDTTLSALKKSVIVPAFKLDSAEEAAGASVRRWKAEFFHNLPGSHFADEKAVDVMMRSSAAPIYYPIYDNFIDGGVVANNPCMCALAQAINNEAGNRSVSEIAMLSVGTGSRAQFIASENGNWGLQQWGFRIVDLLLEADGGLSDYQCRQLLGSRYQRIDVTLAEEIALDAVGRIDDLLELADSFPLAGC